MNQPCKDASLSASDRVHEAQPVFSGITSAAQEAYEPGSSNCTGRNAPCLPKEGTISFDDIFKAIDKDKSGAISLCEFRDFARSLMGEKPPIDRPVTPLPEPVKPPVDRPVTPLPEPVKPPIDRPVTPLPPVENHPTGNFSTRNGRIYDPSGREFQPRGFDIDNPNVALQDVDKIDR
jgi:EF hand.